MATEARRASAGALAILIPVLAGSAIAVALGVLGNLHEPQFFSINLAGFSSAVAVKTWLATLAVVLALFQLGSAFAMYGSFPGRTPSWISTAHVWSGRVPNHRQPSPLPLAVRVLLLRRLRDQDAPSCA
jgi:Zn-dependent protease